MDHRQEVDRVLLESSRHAAKMLQSVEHTFDDIALPIEAFAERIYRPCIAFGRNYGSGAGLMDIAANLFADIAAVGEHVSSLLTGQQGSRLSDIVDLAGRNQQPQRQPPSIAQQVNLRAQSSSGTPQSLVVFFLEPAAC